MERFHLDRANPDIASSDRTLFSRQAKKTVSMQLMQLNRQTWLASVVLRKSEDLKIVL